MAFWTFAKVAGRTLGSWLMTRDTVLMDTDASLATSVMVAFFNGFRFRDFRCWMKLSKQTTCYSNHPLIAAIFYVIDSVVKLLALLAIVQRSGQHRPIVCRLGFMKAMAGYRQM